MNNYGYYIFLGHGDYHDPAHLDSSWTSTWNHADWKSFLQNLVDLNCNTLMLYLTGHYLPYKSIAFPELIQNTHPNVQKEFMVDVLKEAKDLGINVIAVFSTTGHAHTFLEKNPHLGIKTRSAEIDLEQLLCPFPKHIRSEKNKKQKGSAQVGAGILCHNNPASQEYAIKLIMEALILFKNFDNIALHPPESIYPCFCDYCKKLFSDKYHKDLLNTSDLEAREFYLETYLDFQKLLESEIKSHCPAQLYTFTIPWLFEPSFEKFAGKISKETILIDWDYNLEAQRINQLKERLLRYQKYGHQIWFMPTAGFGFNGESDLEQQINKVHQQIEIAIDANAEGVVHFVGPHLTLNLEKTIYAPTHFTPKP